jgi:hypothetical protein
MENKFREGETVVAKVRPEVLLVIRRYVDRIYFCRLKDKTDDKDLVYFEREIERAVQ